MSGVKKSYKMVKAKRRINKPNRKSIRIVAYRKVQRKTGERVLVSPTKKGGTYPGETGLAEIDE